MKRINTSTMRFQPRRLVRVLTAVIVLWLGVTLVRYLWQTTSSLWEEEDIDLGPLESDTDIPQAFLRSSEGTSTPVVVVEEHYEVLKYWFAASESGLVPQTGNVLFHIDGHSDGGVPHQLDVLPLFRAPVNIQEVNNMMQRNDVFIVAAALAGLIDRYIWVWPPWDEPNHESDHVIMDMQVGYVRPSMLDTDKLELCYCMEMRDADISECRMRNVSDPEGDGTLIGRSGCNLNKSGTVEVVSEQKAISLMQTRQWINSHHRVILDIDEDYYGCQSAGESVYSTGIKSSVLNSISHIMCEMFCARSVHHETLIDTFFHTLVQLVHRLKTDAETVLKDSTKHKKNLEVQKIVFTIVPEIFQQLNQDPVGEILCNNPTDMVNELFLQGIFRNIVHMNIQQLASLAETGVCLQLSPKAYFYDVASSVHVCEGANSPNSSMVLFHTPTPFEVHERTINLKKLLNSKSINPSLITVCRSVRDGYTPRKLFPRIEADILKLLHHVFPDVHYVSVYHDKDLLGGASGWHDRHFHFESTYVYKLLQKYPLTKESPYL
ncbi:uncharacterized protein LOC124141128 [Haliotis rufescens]|uniref:uncharacterized protein LOC124141128 n=1 Tax=Haliotis rufescens TaxID=6454 RepID=UPI00201F5D8A|nr:uncharacterized protein LOC124141128 [Haliotis rufescens]